LISIDIFEENKR